MLSDFGIAMVLQQNSSHLSLQGFGGTPIYAAPEQFKGYISHASDQYALGVMVYEWLTGDWPFTGDLLALGMQKTQHSPPPLRPKVPSIPPAREDAVLSALSPNPKDRFVNVGAFATGLAEASKQRTSFSYPPTPQQESLDSISSSSLATEQFPDQHWPQPNDLLLPVPRSSHVAYFGIPRLSGKAGVRLLILALLLALASSAAAGSVLSLHPNHSNSPPFDRHGLPSSVPLPNALHFVKRQTSINTGSSPFTIEIWIWDAGSPGTPTSIANFYQHALPGKSWTQLHAFTGSNGDKDILACQVQEVLLIVASAKITLTDSQGAVTLTHVAPPGGSALGIYLSSSPALLQPLCSQQHAQATPTV